jgi:CubicO group peptidase (beta-lactamase class C family)
MRPILLLILLSLLLVPAVPARADTPAEASDKLRVFLDGIPDLGPGYAVVVVDRDKHLLDYVRGQRDAGTGAPLTLDTPIYIASQTKSYLGLLAHILDRRGVLHLDSTLADHWPDLKLPDGVDPAAWTLADLLNHRVPISADALTVLEAYLQSPDPATYPQLLARFATARPAGFDYDNLGYNVYAAILFRKTGKSWQHWLDEELFGPLGLAHTSTRTSTFDTSVLAASHTWLGEAEGWERIGSKPDGVMHSAGGMVTSPNDLARWLQLHLGSEAPDGFDAGLLAAAHRKGVDVDPKARNAYELPCDGYSFGWNQCEFEGHRLFIHGGSYTGARTMMAFAPDLGVGIGVFSNSDNMTGWLTSRTVVQFLQYLVDHPEAESWASTRQKMYPERVAEYLGMRRKQLAEVRADPQWQGWRWTPDADELAAYAGRYRGERLPVTAELATAPQGLQLKIGALQRRLAPARLDLFGATWLRLDPPQPLRFERDGEGRITGFEFDGERYRRQPAE